MAEARLAREILKKATAIRVMHRRSRESYGVRRMQPELRADGFTAGRDRIARLRREMSLRCRQKRKFKATTNSQHEFPVAENLLDQTFKPTAPNQIWVADITSVPTEEGWLYLAGIKDVFTYELVGYAMGAHMTQDRTAQALFRAVQQKRPEPGLIHHSDRGSQYCAQAEASIREYIEIFYNRQHRHSQLGYQAPLSLHNNMAKNNWPSEYRVSILNRTPHIRLTLKRHMKNSPRTACCYTVLLLLRSLLADSPQFPG